MPQDTVPYDADEAAWEGWQVPSAPAVNEDAVPPRLGNGRSSVVSIGWNFPIHFESIFRFQHGACCFIDLKHEPLPRYYFFWQCGNIFKNEMAKTFRRTLEIHWKRPTELQQVGNSMNLTFFCFFTIFWHIILRLLDGPNWLVPALQGPFAMTPLWQIQWSHRLIHKLLQGGQTRRS